jgi:hypothetical protein
MHTNTLIYIHIQELIITGWEPSINAGNRSAVSETNTTQDEERRGTAALKEQRQMESIKAKRRQELEQMVAYELKLTQVLILLCMCVCMCISVCVCVCVYIYIYIYIYVYMYICIYSRETDGEHQGQEKARAGADGCV